MYIPCGSNSDRSTGSARVKMRLATYKNSGPRPEDAHWCGPGSSTAPLLVRRVENWPTTECSAGRCVDGKEKQRRARFSDHVGCGGRACPELPGPLPGIAETFLAVGTRLQSAGSWQPSLVPLLVMPWGGVGVAPECRLNDSSTLQSSWSEQMSIT